MKEMEAKTENRYEYRKSQEKRKQMIAPDLFELTDDCQAAWTQRCGCGQALSKNEQPVTCG